jgi:integrase
MVVLNCEQVTKPIHNKPLMIHALPERGLIRSYESNNPSIAQYGLSERFSESDVDKINLTVAESVAYLVSREQNSTRGEANMKGVIRPKETRCPVCNKEFHFFPRIGYICLKHKTVPKRFMLDLWAKDNDFKADGNKKQRLRICSDVQGLPLDTYRRALALQEEITRKMQDGTFDVSHYLKSARKKFFTASLIEIYIALKIDNIAPSNQKDFKHRLKVAGEYFKDKDVREIDNVDIENYKLHLEKSATLKVKTVKNYMVQFKTFMRWVQQTANYIKVVPMFPVIEIRRQEVMYVQLEKQPHILELYPDEEKNIFKFLMLHGCRPSEARALQCGDVDINNQSVRISKSFSKNVLRDIRKSNKDNPAPDYEIPIHPEMLDFFIETIADKHPQAYVFPNPRTGRPYTDSAFWNVTNHVRKEHHREIVALLGDVKKFTPYIFGRHSFCSNLANQGVPMSKVSRAVGHSNEATTKRYYVGTELEELRDVVTKITLEQK